MNKSERQWKIFSRLFREYNSNQFGYCQCFTCGEVYPWKQMDTGHYIDRRYAATKFNILNLEPQCQHCNRTLDGNIEAFEKYLKIKYGKWEVKNHLIQMSLFGSIPTVDQVNGLIQIYRELNKMKGS